MTDNAFTPDRRPRARRAPRAAGALLLALAATACAAPKTPAAPPPASAAAAAPPPAATLAAMDAVAEAYVKLVLAVGVHDPDYVDAYYGPAEWRAEAQAAAAPLAKLRASAEAQIAILAALPEPTEELDRLRRRFLARQLAALASRVDLLGGAHMSFDEESKALYDAVAPTYDDAHFDALLAKLDEALPGAGAGASLTERYAALAAGFVIPPDRLSRVFDAAIAECRRRTCEHVHCRAGESFTVGYVTGKPWGAYNWYQGNYHSLIQVNTDLPIYVDRAVDLACHEGYPGHHVYNALLEQHLLRERGWVEFEVYPLFSPESLIAEGSANFGIEVAFPGAERTAFERDVLFPLAGLDPGARRGERPRAGAGRGAELRRQRGRPPLPERRHRRRRGRRLAGALRPDDPRAGRPAGELHRQVPELRHQLQPGRGPGATLGGGAGGDGGPPGAALAGLHRTALDAPPPLRAGDGDPVSKRRRGRPARFRRPPAGNRAEPGSAPPRYGARPYRRRGR